MICTLSFLYINIETDCSFCWLPLLILLVDLVAIDTDLQNEFYCLYKVQKP